MHGAPHNRQKPASGLMSLFVGLAILAVGYLLLEAWTGDDEHRVEWRD